jgi:hypothetical protein
MFFLLFPPSSPYPFPSLRRFLYSLSLCLCLCLFTLDIRTFFSFVTSELNKMRLYFRFTRHVTLHSHYLRSLYASHLWPCLFDSSACLSSSSPCLINNEARTLIDNQTNPVIVSSFLCTVRQNVRAESYNLPKYTVSSSLTSKLLVPRPYPVILLFQSIYRERRIFHSL